VEAEKDGQIEEWWGGLELLDWLQKIFRYASSQPNSCSRHQGVLFLKK
jgi:hypothetical protein